MAEIVALFADRFNARLMRFQRRAGFGKDRGCALHRGHQALMLTKGIQQITMTGRIGQSPIIMLAVDFNQRLADCFEHLHTHRLIIDQSTGASVCHLDASEDDIAVLRNVMLTQQGQSRMIRPHGKHGCHLPLCLAMAHQRPVAARPQGQGKGVQQNGFARPRFTGQHAHPLSKTEAQTVD